MKRAFHFWSLVLALVVLIAPNAEALFQFLRRGLTTRSPMTRASSLRVW